MKPFISDDPLAKLAAAVLPGETRFSRLVFGERYCSVMLSDGRSGVCATLGTPPPVVVPEKFVPDLATPAGRIITQAVVNAVLNGKEQTEADAGVKEAILASGFSSMVMIGYFMPLVKPLIEAGIDLKIFDRNVSDSLVMPPEALPEALQHCPLMVLTSTTLSNGSFAKMLEHVSPGTEVWMLGPSTPLTSLMAGYPSVTRLFGTLFPADCHQLHDLVAHGAGTREFNHLGNKVCLSVNPAVR